MSPPSPIMSAEERRAALDRETREKGEERAKAVMQFLGGLIVCCLLVTSALLSLAVVVWAGKLLWRVAVRG